MGVMVRHSRGEYMVEFADWGRVAEAMPGDAFVVTDRTVAALMPEGLAEEERVLLWSRGNRRRHLRTWGGCVSGCRGRGRVGGAWWWRSGAE